MARRRSRSSAFTPETTNYSLADLWRSEYSRFRNSRNRVAQAGRLRRNEILPHVPADIENADGFRITVPHALLMVQNIINYLTRKQPGIRRPSMAGPMATRTADKIEHWLGAPQKGGALGELKSNGESVWEAFVAHGANDGEYGLLVLPRPAAWTSLLNFTEPADDDQDGTQITAYFMRDSQGRSPEDDFYADDPHGFETDWIQSSKAFYEYDSHEKARALPFVIEVFSPEICLPIGVDPATGKVDAMLLRSVRSVRSLKQLGFEWDIIGQQDAADDNTDSGSWSPSQVLKDGGLQVTLYALVLPGGIYYQVGDCAPGNQDQSRTTRGKSYKTYLRRPSKNDDTGETEMLRTAAYVDLEHTYGICEVPGGYFYGAHHPSESDPDKKGIPLLSIFAPLVMGINQTISSVVHHAYEVGFGGWFADPSGADPKYWTENGAPTKVKVHRGAVSYVAGKITPAVHSGVDKDVSWFVQMALSMIENFGPSASLTSGDPADGGFSQAVAQASGENAIGQILAGAMSALQRTCECLLEQASALSDMLGEPIPVYAHYDPKSGSFHNLLELSAKDLHGDFSVEVIFPMKKGSNLALAQGMFQWWKGGALSLYTWLQDGWGEEHPDEEVDRINVENALKSEQGQNLIWELAARMQGDREMAKIAKLKQDGELGPGGVPTALMPPRPGMGPSSPTNLAAAPGPADGGVPAGNAGVEVGNTAASAMGGIMAGQMMTGPNGRVAAATGQGAPMPAGGPNPASMPIG